MQLTNKAMQSQQKAWAASLQNIIGAHFCYIKLVSVHSFISLLQRMWTRYCMTEFYGDETILSSHETPSSILVMLAKLMM